MQERTWKVRKEVEASFDGFGERGRQNRSHMTTRTGHEDVPLECFFRWDREPVFRIREMRANGSVVDLLVEYGREKKRERIRLRRDERWQLKPESRRVVS